MKSFFALCLCTTLLAAPPVFAQGTAPATVAPATTVPATAAPTQVPASSAQVKMSYAPVVKRVAPAVVNIYTKRVVDGRVANPFFDDPFFAPFFNGGSGGGFAPLRKRVEQSLGSGVIIDASGLIVTNAHVIKDAQQIVVALSDGHEYEARSVLVDTPSDIGLLRIDTKGTALPTARLSASDTLEVGDLVLAIGNPFGVGQTVTGGIVSALARSNTNINDYDFFIQTDAAINPGNSGGPLVDMDGRVVGINSAIYSRSGGSLGIGFAIPAEMVRAVLAAEKSGQVSQRGVVRPWLGFAAQSVSADIATSLGLTQPKGALVAEVAADGPADDAGLKRGDVITTIDGRDIRDAEELKFRIATLPIGKTATLGVNRNGQAVSVPFTAAPPPEKPAREPVTLSGTNIFNGATIVNVSPAVIAEMDIKGQDDGVVIYAVRKNGTAARVGLQPGDGIIAIGNHRVSDTRQMQALIDESAAQGPWVLTIRRDGRDQTIILR